MVVWNLTMPFNTAWKWLQGSSCISVPSQYKQYLHQSLLPSPYYCIHLQNQPYGHCPLVCRHDSVTPVPPIGSSCMHVCFPHNNSSPRIFTLVTAVSSCLFGTLGTKSHKPLILPVQDNPVTSVLSFTVSVNSSSIHEDCDGRMSFTARITLFVHLSVLYWWKNWIVYQPLNESVIVALKLMPRSTFQDTIG